MKAIIKAVSKFKGLLINDDKAWWNATKEAKDGLPDDMHQFIGKEVELVLVEGKDHSYSGFSVIGEGSRQTEVAGSDNGGDLHNLSLVSRELRISRFAALKSALKAMDVSGTFNGVSPDKVLDKAVELADRVLDEWVLK